MNTAQSKAQHSDQLVEAPVQNYAQERIAWYKRGPGRRKGSITQQPSYLPLLFCLLIAIVVRAFIVIHTQGFIDGDEALVGIQAEHILRGELPIYFYNQPYMGSLEAYIMAGIFAIVGPSVWALRAEPILLSLIVVWLTWKLASALADTVRLPLHAKQWFMTIAAFLAAIPPLYDTVLQLRTLGGYVEIFIFMLLLMLFALALTNRRAAGASRRELAWRWASIGFIIGLGLWVNPLIFYAIFAAAMWIAWDWVKALKEARRSKIIPFDDDHLDRNIEGARLAPVLHTPARQTFLRTLLLPALASIPACIVGLTPAIYWGALNQWQNITYILQLSGNPPLRPVVQAQYPTRLDIFFGLAHLYTTCVGPRILSGALPGENAALGFLYTPTFIFSGLCILATIALVALSFTQPHPLLLTVRRLAALPIVFASSVSIIFCVTETAASGLWSCQYDFAGRYATPLMLVIPFFVATIFTVVILLEADTYTINHEQALDGGQTRVRQENTIEFESASNNSAPASPRASSLATLGLPYWKIALGLLVGILILSVYLQVALYAASDAGSTFQSTFCTYAPANNDAIIAYLEREHIHYAWANNWIAYPIIFKSHDSIIVSDPLPIIRNTPILDRIPAYTEAVRKADRPSFLILVKHNDPYPLMLELLDIQKVRYNVARFPSQEGRDVLVITPLNQTVSPLDNFFFNIFICSRDG
ncbi:MAG TPA: hypothetical protein VIX20_09705 [Ktedonobacteraceae bacterium]